MIIRIARVFTIVLVFNLLVGVLPTIGAGLSLPKLLPVSKTETKKIPPKPSKPEPSTLDRMTAGTKSFFSSIGSALGLKKSAPQRQSTIPTNPWIKPAKEEPPKSSWFTSKEEPDKPSNPSEWLQQKRLDP